MPPKKKKNAITFFIETTMVPELQREGYQFRNSIAALIPEASRRYKVDILVFCVITYQLVFAWRQNAET